MHEYCNNCDKLGHTFHTCRKPIESNGVIAFRLNSNNVMEYLAVCRRHTFGYIDFMRGKYGINNKSHIKDIIYEMTNKEKYNILNLSFLDNWKKLWGSTTNAYYLNEKVYAGEKFKMLKQGVTINGEYYNIDQIIRECKSSWDTPEWGFPKGRKNYKEESLKCALREWSEETGIPNYSIDIITNIQTFDEVIIGSNYSSYKDRYYLANLKNEFYNIPIKFQKSEMSDAKWLSYSELKDIIRPYNKERIKIIKNVDNLLNKYSQYIYTNG